VIFVSCSLVAVCCHEPEQRGCPALAGDFSGPLAESSCRRAMGIAADICVYTNRELVVETL